MRNTFLYLLLLPILFVTGPLLPTPSYAANKKASPSIALVYYSSSRKSDKAFIEMARIGAEKAKKELNIDYSEYRLPANENINNFLHKIAEDRVSHIIAIGYQHVLPVLNIADQYPHIQFTVIDGLVPPLYPNVQSIIFKDHEGAFLIGMAAAYNSKSKILGFIGGMDVPLIRNFGLGFIQGAKFVNPNITIKTEMVGSNTSAWSNPARAEAIANSFYDDGVDVIFAAAGGSGLGVLKTAAQRNKLAIGVDTNQNKLYPGHILTSLVKRVDKAVFNVLKTTSENKWQPGIKQLGLKDAALDYAVDQYNSKYLTAPLIEQLETAKERIIRGFIKVQMYSPN